MKILRNCVLITAAIFFIPASSFALIDAGVYGGYSFAGKAELQNNSETIYGWEYGGLAHINDSLFVLINVGIGLYFQQSLLKFTLDKNDADFTKTTYGIDLIVSLDIPIFPIEPYVRGGAAINESDKIKGKALGATYSHTTSSYFKSFYGGVGCAFSVLPMIQIFGEYLYLYSKPGADLDKSTGNSFHLGARLSI